MTKYTTVTLTIRQIAGLRVMLKLEAISNFTAGVMDGEDLKSTEPIIKAAAMVGGILSTVNTWNVLDRPLELALRIYDDAATENGTVVDLDTPIEVNVFTDALGLYHTVIVDGIYKKAIEDARQLGDQAPELDVPIRLMEDVQESLAKVFPAGDAAFSSVAQSNEEMTFPVRGGGMVN